MALSKEYLEFVPEQFSELNEITYRELLETMYDELPAAKKKK